MSHQAYIGIGSNLGSKKENYQEALARIAKMTSTKIVKESSLYESEPLGESKERYANGVIEIATDLKPDELLKKCKNIERAMGRKQTALLSRAF